jgi:hypothetical protein
MNYRFKPGDEVIADEMIFTEDEDGNSVEVPSGTRGAIVRLPLVPGPQEATYYVKFEGFDEPIYCFQRDLLPSIYDLDEHIEHVEWERNRYLEVLDLMGIGACDVDDILRAGEWPSHIVQDSYYFLETEVGTPWMDLDTYETLRFDTYAEADEYGQANDKEGRGYAILISTTLGIHIDQPIEEEEGEDG